jgi:hypothetical protein
MWRLPEARDRLSAVAHDITTYTASTSCEGTRACVQSPEQNPVRSVSGLGPLTRSSREASAAPARRDAARRSGAASMARPSAPGAPGWRPKTSRGCGGGRGAAGARSAAVKPRRRQPQGPNPRLTRCVCPLRST